MAKARENYLYSVRGKLGGKPIRGDVVAPTAATAAKFFKHQGRGKITAVVVGKKRAVGARR